MKRRAFIEKLGIAGIGFSFGGSISNAVEERVAGKDKEDELFTISLSQWGFHRAIFGDAQKNYSKFIKTLHTSPDEALQGKMDPRDIVIRARELGVGLVDLVNICWFGHAKDGPWLRDFKTLAANEGVGFGVLMCDEVGLLGAAKKVDRDASLAKHREWMEAAAELGCPFLRVNAYGEGNYLEQMQRNAESLYLLAEASKDFGLEVLVENHGHPSSNAAWLAMLMEMTDHPRTGVFTDFDNFFMGGWGHVPQRRYDRLQGMLDLAPYTKAVSAKSYDFGEDGNETTVDFDLCFKTALDAGFRGIASAEYEGSRLSEAEGSARTVALLRRVDDELAGLY